MWSFLINFSLFVLIPLLYSIIFFLIAKRVDKKWRALIGSLLFVLTFYTCYFIHQEFIFLKIRNLDYQASVFVKHNSDTVFFARDIERGRMMIDLQEEKIFVDGLNPVNLEKGDQIEITNKDNDGQRTVIPL